MTKVSVLLSTYSGERFLKQLIDSVLAQQGVTVELFVRDDGSKDGTVAILDGYAQKGLLKYTAGENIGFAKSFFWLVQNAPQNDYYAFCDQDDVWHGNKLASAAEKLEPLDKTRPNLYHSALRVVDENLVLTHASTHKGFVHPPDDVIFPNSLMQNWVYGCTMVFNEELRRTYAEYAELLYCHDWTMYQIAAGLGKVIFDPVPKIDYRQHGANVFGFFMSGWTALKKNLKLFFQKESKNLRLCEAKKFYAMYYGRLDDKSKALLDKLVNYKRSAKDKRVFRREKAFRVKGIVGFYHRVLLAFGKL